MHVDEAKEESSYTNVSYYDQSIEGTPKVPKLQRDFPKQMGKRKLHYGSHVWRNEEHERLTNNDPIQQKQSKGESSEREIERDIGYQFPQTEKPTDAPNHIVDESESMRRVQLNQNESLVLIAETLGSSIRKGFEMPKRDCLKFDGNPMNYPRFIANFKTNIEERELSPNVRLTYLIQFCTGTAKEAISNCVMLPENEAYSKAREILHNLYGQSHIITRAYIDKVTKGGIIRDGESEKLQQLARDMENCQINLTQLGCESEINAQSNLEKIVARLPRYLQAEWAKEAFTSLEKGKVPTFKDLTTYITVKSKLASSAFGQLIGSKPHDDKQKPRKQYGTSYMTGGERSILSCYFCKNTGHILEKCYLFRNENLESRKKFIHKEKLCNICFGKGHFAKQCRKRDRCMVAECGQRHHTLLHPIKSTSLKDSRDEDEEKSKEIVSQREAAGGQCTVTGAGRPGVRLRVIPIKVRSVDETREIETYALLDDGSDVSVCDSALVKKLGITGVPTTFSLTTVNGGTKNNCGEEVRLLVSDLNGSQEVDITRAWTVGKLPISKESIPTADDVAQWNHLEGLEFPELKNENVSIIIGSDVPEAHWVLDQRRGDRKEPYAVKTLLGWALMGPVGTETRREFQVNFIQNQDNCLKKQVERMMQIDFGENDNHLGKRMSLEDHRALRIMEDSVKKVDSHYEIALPWRSGKPALPNNRTMADKRLISLQTRLRKDPDLRERYRNVIEDYIEKGYAVKVTEENQSPLKLEESSNRVWYIPHHPVFHPQKPEKLRVVFDCAAKFKDTSLNEQLLQGPDLNNTLLGVLIRFREEPVAITSDVEAMFHQVRVTPQDCNALRFPWWPDADLALPPQEYMMKVHLFGATSSPSCASFALQRTAEDHKDMFDKEAVHTVKRNFYVDDCLKSVPSVETAKCLTSQLRELLAKGGFHLTKWASNSREVLASIPAVERAPSMVNLDFGSVSNSVALGVGWNVETDSFLFRISDGGKVKTRRAMLSFISSLYDPLGAAGPFVLHGRQLLQHLCRVDYDWDEEISEEDLAAWQSWQKLLSQLSNMTIPRCFKLNLTEKLHSVQLHSFSDASRLGYGAVSYLRIVDEDGKLNVSFVVGKARVTPMKQITIPRMELTAAVLATKLSRQVEEELEIQISDFFFWTDSMVVLQYINNESTRFQTFVANRLAVIHSFSKPSQWRYVDTNCNPADSASRGLKPTEVKKIDQWFNGPEFLRNEEDTWPKFPVDINIMADEQLEWRKNVHVNEILAKKQSLTTDDFLQYYSTWYALQKGVAWLIRFASLLKHRSREDEVASGPLKVSDIRTATDRIVRYLQQQEFTDELKALQTSSEKSSQHPFRGGVIKRSKLEKLNPILIDGVLRVGGRVERSIIPFNAKHPIILPQHHHVIDLIIRHYHTQEGHMGPTQVLATIRQMF